VSRRTSVAGLARPAGGMSKSKVMVAPHKFRTATPPRRNSDVTTYARDRAGTYRCESCGVPRGEPHEPRCEPLPVDRWRT